MCEDESCMICSSRPSVNLVCKVLNKSCSSHSDCCILFMLLGEISPKGFQLLGESCLIFLQDYGGGVDGVEGGDTDVLLIVCMNAPGSTQNLIIIKSKSNITIGTKNLLMT